MTLKEEKDLVKKIAEVKDFRKFVLGRWDNAAHERAAIALQTRAAEEAKQLAARREAAARRAEERRDGSALLARCSQSSRSSHSQTYCTSRSTSPVPGDKKKPSPSVAQLLHLQDVGPLFRRPDLGAVTFEVRRFAPRRASSVLRGHGQSGTTVLHAPSKDVLKYSYLLNHKHCQQLRALRHLRAFNLFFSLFNCCLVCCLHVVGSTSIM